MESYCLICKHFTFFYIKNEEKYDMVNCGGCSYHGFIMPFSASCIYCEKKDLDKIDPAALRKAIDIMRETEELKIKKEIV